MTVEVRVREGEVWSTPAVPESDSVVPVAPDSEVGVRSETTGVVEIPVKAPV